MNLNFSIPLFIPDLVRALSWTLIHSLWQGMLLAVAAGGIIFFTKKTSPAIRYNLLTGCFLLFIAGIVLTFGAMMLKESPVVQTLSEIQDIAATELQSFTASESIKDLSAFGKTESTLNEYAGWIVCCWLSVILLRCIYLTAGLYNVYQLKRKQTFSAGEYWNSKLIVLSRQLKINRPVKLLQSGVAAMPAVIGYFKPIILFPAGMLASLPPDEVEAILIHELAHIRRKDFLVNVLQYIIEIIFFFHPAIKWVSARIRQERENCCDDIAVSQTGNKRNYISALIAFQEFGEARHLPLANALAGEKNHLINRVKRIINNNNKTLNNMEKKLLAAGMIVTSVFIFAFSSNDPQYQVIKSKIPATQSYPVQLQVINDTLPKSGTEHMDNSNLTIIRSVNGKKYKIVAKNNTVTELFVNDKKIPAEKMGSYKSVTSKILKQSKKDAEISEKDMENAKEEVAESQEEREEMEKQLAEAKIEIENAKVQMEEDMVQARTTMEEANKEMEQARLNMEQAMVNYKGDQKETQKAMVQAKKDMERTKREVVQAKIEIARSMKEIELSKQQIEQSKLQIEQSKIDIERSKKVQEMIMEDLIKEGVIKDKNAETSYKLNNNELIVNGVKQPDAIHAKFKDKYLTGSNQTINYYHNYHEEIK